MGEFKDHPSKKVIRMEWGKPLIQFIHNALGYKFIYLGLPGPQALDLLKWIDYIEGVIAFQCRSYPNPSSIQQPRDKVKDLEHKLRELERQGKLKTFSIYDGYIEEVILRGRDTLGNLFSQNEIVTIYNSDFCNGITSPLKVADDKGEIHKYYKSQAIRRLLEVQRDIMSSHRAKKFVMFLTIHSYFLDEEAKKFFKSTDSAAVKKYMAKITTLKERERSVRKLKVYIFDTLKSFFSDCEFTPEFLPIIFYKGSEGQWLLLFTIIGTHSQGCVSRAEVFQNPDGFLSQQFLTVQGENIIQMPNPRKFPEDYCHPDPVKHFEHSELFRRLWRKD